METIKERRNNMSLFANVLSFLSIAAGTSNSQFTILLWTDEPTCPQELL